MLTAVVIIFAVFYIFLIRDITILSKNQETLQKQFKEMLEAVVQREVSKDLIEKYLVRNKTK